MTVGSPCQRRTTPGRRRAASGPTPWWPTGSCSSATRTTCSATTYRGSDPGRRADLAGARSGSEGGGRPPRSRFGLRHPHQIIWAGCHVCDTIAMLEPGDPRARRLRDLLAQVVSGNRFYAPKLAAWDGEDLDAVPFTLKSELVADQHEHPPYGSNLSFPFARYCRLHQ